MVPAGALCLAGPARPGLCLVWKGKGVQLTLGRLQIFPTPGSWIQQLPGGSPRTKAVQRAGPGRGRGEHQTLGLTGEVTKMVNTVLGGPPPPCVVASGSFPWPASPALDPPGLAASAELSRRKMKPPSRQGLFASSTGSGTKSAPPGPTRASLTSPWCSRDTVPSRGCGGGSRVCLLHPGCTGQQEVERTHC